MGLCLSSEKAVSKPAETGAISKLNIHPATGLCPGDVPYPTRSSTASRQGTPSRRPSTTDSSGKKSPVPSSFNPGGLLLALASITDSAPPPDNSAHIELDLYDTCPTPYAGNSKADIVISEEASCLMRIEFVTALVDDRNVKQHMDELITGPEPLHITGGLRTVLGVCPDSDEEVFKSSYLYRSEYQQHITCDRNKEFCLRAPKGCQLRIICVSYHGHDYVASANALLQNKNTLLEIPAGKLEEKLKCPPPKGTGTLSLEAPFLFTYVLESDVFHKTCGLYEDFFIDKYEFQENITPENGASNGVSIEEDAANGTPRELDVTK